MYGLNTGQINTQSSDKRICDSSQNGNNSNSPTLNMTDSVNVESVDNAENSHTMSSINKGNDTLLQTAWRILINKKNKNLNKNIKILFDFGSQKFFINDSLSKVLGTKIF